MTDTAHGANEADAADAADAADPADAADAADEPATPWPFPGVEPVPRGAAAAPYACASAYPGPPARHRVVNMTLFLLDMLSQSKHTLTEKAGCTPVARPPPAR